MVFYKIRLGIVDESGNLPDRTVLRNRSLVNVYLNYCEEYKLKEPTISPEIVTRLGYSFYDLFDRNKDSGFLELKGSDSNFKLSFAKRGVNEDGSFLHEDSIIGNLGNKLRIMETDSEKSNIPVSYCDCEEKETATSEYTALKFINIGPDSRPTDMIIGPNVDPSVISMLKKIGIKCPKKPECWENIIGGKDYVLTVNNKNFTAGGRRQQVCKNLIEFYKSLKDTAAGGKPSGGKPVGGKPVGGKPSGGKPVGGKPTGDKQMRDILSLLQKIKKQL